MDQTFQNIQNIIKDVTENIELIDNTVGLKEQLSTPYKRNKYLGVFMRSCILMHDERKDCIESLMILTFLHYDLNFLTIGMW